MANKERKASEGFRMTNKERYTIYTYQYRDILQ